MLQDVKFNSLELLNRLRDEGVSLWEEHGQLHYRVPKGTLNDDDIQLLKAHKMEILNLLRFEARQSIVIPDLKSRFEPFPLTDVQSAYLLGRQGLFEYGGVSCHIYLELNYAELNLKRTEEVWNHLILRHDMLRAVIDSDGKQRVFENVPRFKVVYRDLSELEQLEAEEKLNEIREQMDHRVYNTERWPLFDISLSKTRNHTILHFSMEFLIADWASIWLLFSEFEALYEEKVPQLPELELTFRDYIITERRLKKSAEYAKDKAYWLNRLDTLPMAPDLPLARQHQNNDNVRFRRRSLQLDQFAWDGIKQRALKLGLTPTTVVMTAYAAVLERWSQNRKFCLNLTLLNRMPLHSQVNQIVGDFTSVNLLAVDWSGNPSFAEQAKNLQKQLFEDLDHRLFSGVEVLREIARRRGREIALMPIVFTSAIGLVNSAEGQRLKGKIGEYGISQTPQVFIDCQAMDSSEGLQVNWDVREGVFPDHMIDDMFNTFEKLLFALAANHSIWEACEMVTLPDWQLTERKRLNNVEAPLPDKQLHVPIIAQAAMMPDFIAVIDSERQLTYKELMQRAAAVAKALIDSGCSIQDRVAVVMDKCAHQVSAVLGALSAGAVYVPIDPTQPEVRRLAMMEDANVRFVLTCSTTNIQWPDTVIAIEVDNLDLEVHPEKIMITEGDPDLPAYIIYTSGSTGQPKGVVISHRAAANTIMDMNRRFKMGSKDRVLGIAQLSFDLSVYDIFGPLSVGGALVYPEKERLTDPSHWVELINKYEITVWNSVPVLMQMLINYLNSEPDLRLPHLRLALLSGDWIPLTLPDAIIERLPTIQVIALGGATEASIWSIYHIYNGLQADWKSIPYGRPLANQGFRILDSKMRDCPVWSVGELYITGHGLALGYLNDQETKARFISHPVDGQRLYRTGDMGRYMFGGEIEFLGREDNQVKIKGHRIELGEIESVLLEHPAVAGAGVVVDGLSKDKSLLGVVELARKNERKRDEELAEFERMISGIEETVAAVADTLSKEAFDSAAIHLDKAVLNSMLYAFQKIGLFNNGDKYSMEDILQCGRIHSKFHWLVRRWVSKLTKAGLLLEHPHSQYSCLHQVNERVLNEYWKQAEFDWNNKISSVGFIDYVRSNAELLPELLSGQQDPVALLFPEGRFERIRSLYFDHVMANYLNDCIGTLMKRIAENHSGNTLRILEVGAGTGATTEKVLSSLKGFQIDYFFTDVASFFIPEAKSRFGHIPGMTFGIFDVDLDFREQGIAPNSFDVVLAAGVLENARDIPASLDRLQELISPGGWLILTEPTEEHAWILASQAFMMMEPGDSLRQETSYLDRNGWIQLLQEYGDGPVLSLPEENHKLSSIGVHLFAKRLKQDRESVSVSELTDFLSQRLPEYMIPSHLQIVDALPMTGNNKIDRRKLEHWRPKTVIEHAAIETEEESADLLEDKISRVWAESLSLPAIGRKQNFYDCGADSLIMAQVAGRLRDLFAEDPSQEEIPFDVLLRHMLNYPTIAELVEFISSFRQTETMKEELSLPERLQGESNAVLTSYGGGKIGPLRVVFHAGLGTMNDFHLLLEHLNHQNLGPVIGITVADVEKYCEAKPSELIEQVADDYTQCLLECDQKQVQLIGYSLGGLIAVEVARRLMEKGIIISDLVLIDSHPVLFDINDDLVIESLFVPNLNISLEQTVFGDVDPSELKRGLLHIFEQNHRTIPQGSSCCIGGDEEMDKVGDLFRKLNSLSMRERFTTYVKSSAEVTGEQMPVEMAEDLFKVYRQSFKAARFSPPPYMGNIRFLLAKEPFSFFPGTEDMTLDFWRDVCLGHFEVTEIEGNHFSCIKEKSNATKLAQLISAPLTTN